MLAPMSADPTALAAPDPAPTVEIHPAAPAGLLSPPVRRLLMLLGALALIAVLGPLLLGGEAVWKPDWDAPSQPPSWAHWFGTDAIGRDILARSLSGLRMSMLIAAVATLAALAIGLVYGGYAGLVGGWRERAMMRALDIVSALPFLLLVILLLALFERSLWLLLVAIAAQAWIDLARVLRAEASRLREAGFVLAARAAGAGSFDLLRRHVIPNLLPLASVYAGLIAANVVLVESFLGFLGLGLVEPWSGLGALLAEGAQEIDSAPWVLLFPAAILCVLLLSLQRLGEALRDALDPRLALVGVGTSGGSSKHGANGRPAQANVTSAANTEAEELSASTSALSVRGLEVLRADGSRLLGTADFELERGQCLGLIGGSGSGKSLTALALTGLLPAGLFARGEMRLGTDSIGLGQDYPPQLRGRRIALVFQDPLASLHPLRRIGVQLRETLAELRDLRGAALHQAAQAALHEVGLVETDANGNTDSERFLRAYPQQLSGGQRQRVMIALALAGNPELLICDEPTSALDLISQHEILLLLERLRRERGLSLIFIGHDLDVVARLADSLLVLQQGRVVEQGEVDVVMARPQAAYTQALLEASKRTAATARPAAASTRATPSEEQSPPGALLRLRGFSLRYSLDQARAVQDINLEIARGECLALLGASGSGKSSLARGLLRLTSARIEGSIELDGRRIDSVGARALKPLRALAQMVFQDPYSTLDPRQRIVDLLAEPLRLHGREVSRDALIAALAEVGLEANALQRYPHAFSGGQRQRIAIARALILQPALLVCDEAVSALDAISRAQVLALLLELQQRRGLGLLFISHDPGVAAELAQRTAVMFEGTIVELGSTAEVLAAPRHAHAQALIEAWRDLALQ
jgi:peptide/nickel transport system ATP-binding protein